MTIKDLKKKYRISDTDLAEWFQYKNVNSFRNGKNGKARLEAGLIKFYQHIKAEASKISDVPGSYLLLSVVRILWVDFAGYYR